MPLPASAPDSRPIVLCSGYGTWARTDCNPAAAAVAALAQQDQPSDCTLVCHEMPVDSEALAGNIEACLTQHRPDIWIGVGVAVSSPVIRAEAVGINCRSFRVPDVAGYQPDDEEILEHGPTAYRSTLPNRRIVNDCRAAGIPATVSFHAGTHLCNQMLYTVQHLARVAGTPALSGFIHVPQSTENVCHAGTDDALVSSMSTHTMSQALAIAVRCSVELWSAQQQEPLLPG